MTVKKKMGSRLTLNFWLSRPVWWATLCFKDPGEGIAWINVELCSKHTSTCVKSIWKG